MGFLGDNDNRFEELEGVVTYQEKFKTCKGEIDFRNLLYRRPLCHLTNFEFLIKVFIKCDELVACVTGNQQMSTYQKTGGTSTQNAEGHCEDHS